MHRSATPNSCLVAILLIVRSASGCSLVFHYPPRPSHGPSAPSRRPSTRGTTTDYGGTSSSSSTTSSSSSDGEGGEGELAPDAAGDRDDDRQSFVGAGADAGAGVRTEASESEYSRTTRRRRKRASAGDDESDDGRKKGDGLPWESVLGFKTEFLASLLAPKASCCKMKFELSVDDLVFLGFPLHVRPDGTWRKRKKRRREGRAAEVGAAVVVNGETEETDAKAETEGAETEEQGREGGDAELDHDADDEGDDGEGSVRSDGPTMSMFHVVFVLNPPELEYRERVGEMFDCVVKRFTRALKHEQAKDGYVWREAEKITRLKEKAAQGEMSFQECWRDILAQSNLAYSISRVYIDISQSQIAHVFLNNSLGLSFQIPVISETSVLPSLTDPQVPGLPLTTASSFGNDESEGDTMLAKHFTLLFLTDAPSILKELAVETTPISASLAHFVKACRPTLSFLQIANQCGLPLHEIQILARHLIHWRKARAIPPIHQRDTYMVSPNADMKRLPHYIAAYARAFPTLPALPKLLAMLSGKPKPFASFIPSRDHRGAYLDILAWLMRHGLVTQLRNFAWIRIPRRIKLRVHQERVLAEAAAAAAAAAEEKPSDSPPGSPAYTHSLLSDSIASLASASSAARPNGDGGEGDAGGRVEDEFEDSFILEPHQASGIESAWLEMVVRDQPPDVKALFDRIMKYFNGQHAIEKIAVREGIGRRDVKRVLQALDGYLVYGRHW